MKQCYHKMVLLSITIVIIDATVKKIIPPLFLIISPDADWLWVLFGFSTLIFFLLYKTGGPENRWMRTLVSIQLHTTQHTNMNDAVEIHIPNSCLATIWELLDNFSFIESLVIYCRGKTQFGKSRGRVSIKSKATCHLLVVDPALALHSVSHCFSILNTTEGCSVARKRFPPGVQIFGALEGLSPSFWFCVLLDNQNQILINVTAL